MQDPAPATASADGELALADPGEDTSTLPDAEPTAAAIEPVEPAGTPPPASADRRWSGPDRVAAALIALHLAVLAWASFPGSFIADDLMRSSEAAGTGLTWKYLTWDVFGHLAPGYRLVFWLQVRIVPLNHDATVALVLLLQGCVGALAWTVVRSLSGRSYRSLLPLAVYLFSALALPSLLWWASALNLIPCHLALLAATRWHLQSVRTGRLRPAVYAALAIAGGLLFWEKTALALVELPLLTFAVLPGGVRARMAGVAARWRQWLIYALPVGLFAIPYLLAGSPYLSPSQHVPLAGVAKFTGTMAWRGLLPGLVGGPLDWTRFVQSYFAVANAPDVMSWLGLAGVVAVLVVAIHQRSRPGTVALLVAIPFLVTALLTVFARAVGHEAGGVFVLDGYQPAAMDYRYLSDLLVPAAIAVALAVSPGRARPGSPVAAAVRVRPSVLAPIAAGVVVLVSLTSAIAYRDSWRQNPVGAYLANVKATLPRSSPGSAPAMYDNPVPELVFSPFWGAYTHPSRLLRPLRNGPKYSAAPPGFMTMLDPQGRAHPAAFVTVSTTPPVKGNCPFWTTGNALTVPLTKPVPAGDWTVVISYYVKGSTPARLSTVDFQHPDPKSKLPPTSLMFTTQQKVGFAGFGQVYGYTARAPFTHVYLDQLTAPVCVLKVEVGTPVPAGGPGG